MCGIAAWTGTERGSREALVLAMLAAQSHRGPDGAGLAAAAADGRWRSGFARHVGGLPRRLHERATCVLGHNWLAIMDRAPGAAQPMIDGSLGLVFNGEIYNYVELRDELILRGERFETDSDTEVLLRIWQRDGVAGLSRLRGMFAFVVYDAAAQTLWAVRDPYGIKPLYRARIGADVLLSSEIRALHVEGAIRRRLRESAVIASAAAGVNTFGPTQTLYEGVDEIPPGHYWRIGRDGSELRAYHAVPPLTEDADDATAGELLRNELEASVRLHLRGTRRIASCVSGGLDSSSVVTMIGRHLTELRQPFAAYSIFSGAAEDNELPLARAVCAGARVEHRVFEYRDEIAARDALEMAVAFEEPNHVIGPINQYLLLRHIAGEGFTVVLDGQGGDELLSAYVQFVPVLLRRMEERGTDTSALRALLERRSPMPFERLSMFQRMFHSPRDWVRAFVWDTDFLGLSHELVDELPETKYYLSGGGEWASFREATYRRRELHYLLRQEDRLGMWFGLECRVPFVDDPLIAVAARLRAEFLLKDGYLKYPYRTMMPELPTAVRWNVTKRGFWETHEGRFPWMGAVSQRLCFESPVLRGAFPKLEANWNRMSFDQRWRLLQHAVLERCSGRRDLDELPLGTGASPSRAVTEEPAVSNRLAQAGPADSAAPCGEGTIVRSAAEPFPYAGLPPYRNWHSAVTAVSDRAAIDPQGPVKFRLQPTASIASAGTCFAQRIAERLRELNLRYVVAEPGGEPLSARYGNVYTSRQLLQLAQRAFGRFDPLERAWVAPAGFVDPFRPAVETFASVEALEADRRTHLAAVRELLTGIDVFLFTLGVTEVWLDRRDGAAFPACPGRGRGVYDPDRHVFRALDVEAVKDDLERFIALFAEVNPAAKLILTVSPVPLAATMLPMHVVRASQWSKSVLKVAAEEVVARHAHVDYFASYDAVMQNLGGERLFRPGERHPTDEVARRVVSFFVRDYLGELPAPPSSAPRAKSDPCDEDVLLELIVADDARRESSTTSAAPRTHGNGTATQVSHPVSIYFVGDSNSLMFKDRIFSVPGSTTLYLGRTLHTQGLRAYDSSDAEGTLNPTLLERLVGEHLLVADNRGGWTTDARVAGRALDFVREGEGRERRDPPIVLFCGMSDWLTFFEEIGGRDIALPRHLDPLPAHPHDVHAVDFEEASALASRHVEPLERTLRTLRSYGLRNVRLHLLPPSPADDESFARTFFAASVHARYRSIRLMNLLLGGACERSGTPFIDVWPHVTRPDGILDPRFRFDVAHLNLDAALVTVKLLHDTLSERDRDQAAVVPVPVQTVAGAGPSTNAGGAHDIVDPAEARLGEGWHAVEREHGETFRWARSDAFVYVPVFNDRDHRLWIDLEPGPGFGAGPLTLEVYDREDALVGVAIVRGRHTVEVVLPGASPALQVVRLHVREGGRRVPGDERVLDFRAFRITVIPERHEVVSRSAGFRVGAGWYRLESFGGSTFRWANNDAEIEVTSPGATHVELDLEPGPGTGQQPFGLRVLGPRGDVLASLRVDARQKVVFPLPHGEPTPYAVTLHVEGGGRQIIGDARTLNFRAFAPE